MNLKQAIKTLDLKKFKTIYDLKSRFRTLVHQYHPDKNPDQDTTLKFREIVDSYEFLLEHIPDLYNYFGVSESADEEETIKSVVESFDDVFEDIFGFSKSGRILGTQEAQPLYLTLEEFAFGVHKTQKLIAYTKCQACHGTGAQEGAPPRICTYCFGQGTLPASAPEKKRSLCPRCQGRGRKISVPCPLCNGFGRIKQARLQEFSVPVGLKPFDEYTLDGCNPQTQRHTEIFVEPRPLRHSIFQIENYDLLCEYHADFEQLDTTQTVFLRTPFEKVPLVLTPKARNGDVVRIKGMGFFKDAQKTQRGDLVVTVKSKKKSWWRRLLGR